MDIVFTIFEWLGVIAFALSGAMVAIQKDMDILGVCVLGAVTATGGGITRDLLLGNTPPENLINPIPALLAIGISAMTFLPFFQKMLSGKPHRIYDKFILIADSMGLGIFTVMGVSIAYEQAEKPSLFLCVFLGVITGVGGGVLRDILSNNKPYIFVKHFYACAALAGALLYALLFSYIGEFFATIIGVCIIFGLRMLAAKYRWKLPKHRYTNESKSQQ